MLDISVQALTQNNIKALKASWLELQSLACPSFFLSWKWIGTWLQCHCLEKPVFIVKASKNENTVALALFVEKKVFRHGFVRSTQWHLHRTGDEHFDQIWIENNDILCLSEGSSQIKTHIWHHLVNTQPQVDEFIVNVFNHNRSSPLCFETSKATLAFESTSSGYYIDLTTDSLTANYLSSISSNTRHQITRSEKLLKQQGLLTLQWITEPEELTQELDATKSWHIAKWHNTNTPSGWENTLFVNFHNELAKNTDSLYKIAIASLKLDNETIANAYLLITEGKEALFYLSCIKPMDDNRIKTGLLLHSKICQELLKRGYCRYDFLAGEARYKKSLANQQELYSCMRLQRKRIKFSIENTLSLLNKKLTLR